MEGPRSTRPTWTPTRLVRVEESYDSSTAATKIKTDATFAIIKTMGNRQGPHALACELVGSQLAHWFGLSVPDFSILTLPREACFVLPRNIQTQPGPAFVSRFVPGRTWGGSEAELRTLVNPEDVTRLVVFDTWVRNSDRHPPDLGSRKPNYANVYLADTDRAARSRLMAIDHTHCFDPVPTLSPRLSDIAAVKDDRTYGLFPAFAPLLDAGQLMWCKSLLKSLPRQTVETMVERIPREWEVDDTARASLVRQIHERAGFLADRIESGWPLGTATRE